jgi:hypothetical protein
VYNTSEITFTGHLCKNVLRTSVDTLVSDKFQLIKISRAHDRFIAYVQAWFCPEKVTSQELTRNTVIWRRGVLRAGPEVSWTRGEIKNWGL